MCPDICNLNDYLEILGQQPSFRGLYTQICFCFPVANALSYPQIISKLTIGLEKVSASFPWIAGQVINDTSESGRLENFRIRPYERIPRLFVKDYRDDPSAPTMNTLREASFPMSILDESLVAPYTTLPGGPGKSSSDILPVFIIQATFIEGGLILTFVGQHNTMDMVAQGHIIRLIDKACRHEAFTQEELASGNLERREIIPLLDDSWVNDPEIAHHTIAPAPDEPRPAPAPPPECNWAYFTFSGSSLTMLKSIATNSIISGFISTDDALSAFIWQRTLYARLRRLDPATTVTFARAVNVRRYLNIPANFPGFVQNMTYHSYKLEKILDEPFGRIASKLRASIDPKTSALGYQTRALATVLKRAADKSTVSFVAPLDLSKDIMLSSWAQLDSYALDFGLGLGKPESVRRPRFPPVESLFYLMPKGLDDEIAVAICLRTEDMENLKADIEFVKYGKFVG